MLKSFQQPAKLVEKYTRTKIIQKVHMSKKHSKWKERTLRWGRLICPKVYSCARGLRKHKKNHKVVGEEVLTVQTSAAGAVEGAVEGMVESVVEGVVHGGAHGGGFNCSIWVKCNHLRNYWVLEIQEECVIVIDHNNIFM